jgi:dTDP-4-amino-4,6-dideoxygalactose transaminase
MIMESVVNNIERKTAGKIWLSSPHMGEAEKRYVEEAFNTNWIAPLGPNVDGFENDIATYLGENVHVAALSSGTAALHLGLILLGVQRGDEVICQSMTFSASANPILYLGATPVFVDSEADTWNMDPQLLEEAIKDRIKKGKKPKAIIVVHLYGMPAKMEEIAEIANKYNIAILEDAAEALGSSINGRKCGSFGKIGILSFNGNKIITTSGGGALVSKDPELVQKARFLATQARDPAPHYEHSQVGYNYRMSNICAGIGRGQMEVLDERVKQRRAVHQVYRNAFETVPKFHFTKEPEGFFSNRWLTTILVNRKETPQGITREEIRKIHEQQNIESRPLWKPMHLQPLFKDFPYLGIGVSDRLFENGLCLPSGSNLQEEHLSDVIKVIENILV